MEIIEQIKKITNEKNILLNEPMSKHTTFKTGGPADVFVTPENKSELIELLKLDIPEIVIGNGSNLLVKDGGIRGMVIKVAFNNYSITDDVIEADSGIALGKLSKIACDNALTGLEFACGIPGTLGGAIYMNAGAYGGEMSNVVIETEFVDYLGNVSIITEPEFGYRKSIFQEKNGVILSAKIKLQKGNQEEIKSKMSEYFEKRNSKQPIGMSSAGSTFKRPKDNFAGKLIEDSGLKGYSIGDAEVSNLHAGFIVNKGNATTSEILELIKHVKEKVNAEYGVMLDLEVKVIGEEK